MRKSLLPVLGAIVLFGSSCHSAARATTKAAPARVKAGTPVIVWQPSHQTDTGADFNEAAVSNGIAEAAMKSSPG